jgi:hypothetical protein
MMRGDLRFVLLVLPLSACGAATGLEGPVVTHDGGLDTGVEASRDVGVDTGEDTGVDAELEAGMDADVEAGSATCAYRDPNVGGIAQVPCDSEHVCDPHAGCILLSELLPSEEPVIPCGGGQCAAMCQCTESLAICDCTGG